MRAPEEKRVFKGNETQSESQEKKNWKEQGTGTNCGNHV